MAEPTRIYAINDILRNNSLLNGAIYWSVYIDKIYEPDPGATWPDTSRIYIKKDATSTAFLGGQLTKKVAQTMAQNNWPVMHGFANDASTEFHIECSVDGYNMKQGETPQHQRLIRFRVDTFLACSKGCPADKETVYDVASGTGTKMTNPQEAPPGDTASVYFYYGTSGGDQLFVKVDKSWPCTATKSGGSRGGKHACLKAFENAKIAKTYWDYDGNPGGTVKKLTYESPCDALRVITGTSGTCYPEWIEYNYVCDETCTPGECDGTASDMAKHVGGEDGICCQAAFGIKPAVGDLIKIDKVGNSFNTEKITSANGGKVRECYVVTKVQADQPTGVTQCACAPSVPAANTLGITEKCISAASRLVERRAPGEDAKTAGCYGAEDRFDLRGKIIETLSSLGWGENIGGFEITGFKGTLDRHDGGYEKIVTVNRMRGHGHFTRTAFSLPGNASSMKFEGGNSWLVDQQFYVDETSWRSVFEVTTSQSMTFIDRWRQTIEYAAQAADPVKNGPDVYELVNAWPPQYLEMFVKRTQTSAATMSLGYNSGRSFEVGLTFNVSKLKEDEKGEFPKGGESTSISCMAFIKFSDLLNYTMKRYGHVNTGGDPSEEFKILQDYLTIEFNFGSSTETMTYKEAESSADDSIISENFSSTLFKGFEAQANYSAVFSNGWTVSVGPIGFSQDGFAKDINPKITLSSPMWKDVLGFTIAQNLNGGGTLGIMFNADRPIIGKEDEDATKLFVHAGMTAAAGWGDEGGSGARYAPSLQFKGQVGSLRTQKFSDILNGFEYDFNLLSNKGKLTRTYDFTKWTSLGEQASATGGFTIEANVNNPSANIFSIRGDFAFEATVKDFGKFWGKLVIRATATVGMELGMPGQGGMMPGGAEFGISFGIYAQLTETTFMEWLGFPFNINPGIGLGIGFKVNFKATSTLTRLEGGDNARSHQPQSNLELSLGPIQWNLSRADGLRQHMTEQHNSWIDPLPFFGGLFTQLPVITRLGSKEGLFQYIVRGSIVRAWTCIGLAVKAYMTDVEKAYKNGAAKFISIDQQLDCSDAQREVKARHRTTYYSRYANSYQLFQEGKTKGACGPKNGGSNGQVPEGPAGFTFDPKDCWAVVEWKPQCHYAAKERDEWVLMNPPCSSIRARWVQLVKDRDYIPFDFTRWPELDGVQGIVNKQMHATEEFVWEKMFEKCEDITWDDKKGVRELVSGTYDTINYGGYERGTIGLSEEGLPISHDEAGLIKGEVVDYIVGELMDGRGGWEIPLIGEAVSKARQFIAEGFKDLAETLGWETSSTRAEVKWPCFKKGCGLDWATDPIMSASACDKAWVQWNYYMDVFYWYIQRWHAMVNACMPYKATCGMVSRGALTRLGYDPYTMNSMPLGLGAVGSGGTTKRLNLPYGEWVTVLQPNANYAYLLIEAQAGTSDIPGLSGAVKEGTGGVNPDGSKQPEAELLPGGWKDWCNANYFWQIYWELMYSKGTTKAMDAAATLLSSIDACSRGRGSECDDLKLYPITEPMKKCTEEGMAGCHNNVLTECSIDDYWALWLEAYPDDSAKEALPYGAARHNDAAIFFDCLCYDANDKNNANPVNPDQPVTCIQQLPELVKQGDWKDHFRHKIPMTMPVLHGNEGVIQQIIPDWEPHMNHSHNFVHGEATPFWYAERGKTSYNQVTLPWDCSIHNSSWQGKEVPMARYGGLSLLATETVPANLRNVMHSLHSSVTIYLDAGPPGASNSPSAGTPSDMPAANVSEIMFHLMHASNLAHYWPTESQSFPVHAALSRVKKDLKLYSKVARCIIMEHHFGNKDFKLRVTDIVKEVGRPGMPPLPDEPGWSEEDKIDFWRTENNNHGIATLWSTGENESLEWWWKPSASGYWTIVTGSNQKPKNEIETPDPITGEDRPKKEGGSVIQWAGGRWSALSKAVATFCFTGGELGTKVELAILRAFQCALCGIESAGSGTSDREAGYRLIYPTTVDLAWLLLGSPDEPRGGLNSPFYPYQPNSTIPKVCGSDDPPGAASDLGALRSLLSSPSACDPEKNCQIVWEATGEVDRGRLAQMGNCSLHLCGKSSAIVGEMSPLEGGYVNNFDPRSDPWGTGVGMPGNTATLALQDPFGGPSRGAGGMAGVAGSPAAEQGSGGIKGGVKMVACCKWDTSEGAPLNAEISMGNMSMEDCQSREGHECVA